MTTRGRPAVSADVPAAPVDVPVAAELVAELVALSFDDVGWLQASETTKPAAPRAHHQTRDRALRVGKPCFQFVNGALKNFPMPRGLRRAKRGACVRQRELERSPRFTPLALCRRHRHWSLRGTFGFSLLELDILTLEAPSHYSILAS
ncbi:MAG TPA: hypothetical protein VJP86_10435 [Vicinamibacterales bacterium]|jgi:hypothetical protein|nr:hypothetical protein [Vicinamibacterales bacterium]